MLPQLARDFFELGVIDFRFDNAPDFVAHVAAIQAAVGFL